MIEGGNGDTRDLTIETDAQMTGGGTQEIEQKGHMTEIGVQLKGKEHQEIEQTIALIKMNQQRKLERNLLILII